VAGPAGDGRQVYKLIYRVIPFCSASSFDRRRLGRRAAQGKGELCLLLNRIRFSRFLVVSSLPGVVLGDILRS